MRISVDASPLLLRSAGVKNYLFYWIQSLQNHALAASGQHSVEPYPFLSDLGDLTHESSVLGRAGTIFRIAWLLASNYIDLPRRMATAGANVFHVTNQVHNGVPGTALTATVHDLTCWTTPEFHTPANIEADRRYARRILRKADGLIAVSENTRHDAIQLLGIDPDKIVTIHSGVPEPYFRTTTADAAGVQKRYRLLKPFILHIGTIEPRKNLDALVDAYLLLPKSVQAEFDLVFAGPVGWAAEATAQRIQSGLPGVRYLGYVAERDLPALTRAATVFAYPSLYEGFGFPVAQAMAAGVPVLTSGTSCLPEITGGAAVLIDPESPASIRDGLDRLLSSPELRDSLARDAAAVAERYHWANCAEESWRFFLRFS